MKGRNEFLVGLVILIGLAAVLGGALWLGQSDFGKRQQVHPARFKTVGGLTPGVPVTYRGVRVGRVEAIRLAGDWVEADLTVATGVDLPAQPAVIAASKSLFGEWTAIIVSRDQPFDDPNVRQMIDQAAAAGGTPWPGATLPDVGQLTAQAGRIATDIAAVAERVQTTFDSTAVRELRGSIRDFSQVVNRLLQFTETQTGRLNQVTGNIDSASSAVRSASLDLRALVARADSATDSGQLQTLMNNAVQSSGDVRQATGDLRSLLAAARSHEANLIGTLIAVDSVMERIQAGQGTLGMLSRDSALYNETTDAMRDLRQLIRDIQANPRKYFKFSVF
jgi:phospholipid/cholesterol/gamma-HCH transport system substrate-binding protein